jgi:hypothetical protein
MYRPCPTADGGALQGFAQPPQWLVSCYFPTPFKHSRAPAFEVTIRTKTPQKILSTLNQQPISSQFLSIVLGPRRIDCQLTK